MITARPETPFEALVVQMEERARTLAEARARDMRLAPGDPRRWRRAGLVWPLFAKG